MWILYRRMYANRHIYTCIFAVWVLRIPLITTAVSAGLPRLPIHPAKIYEVQSIYWAFRDPLATKAFSASLYVPVRGIVRLLVACRDGSSCAMSLGSEK